MHSDIPTTGVPRRTFTTALAWSVPTVAVALAAPAASASGELSARAYDISDVAVGDSTGLSIELAQDGRPLADGAVVTVNLSRTDTVEFDPDAAGYVSPTIATASVGDGVATAVVLVRAAGSFTGVVAYGASQVSYTAGVTLA